MLTSCGSDCDSTRVEILTECELLFVPYSGYEELKFVSDLENVVMLLMRFASEKSWVQLAT